MYKRILILVISLLAVGTAIGALAQPLAGSRGPMAFEAMDLDGDGYVSSGEFSEHRDARMAARAAQGRLLRKAGQAPRFERWDSDGNGLLSFTEVSTGQQTRFAERRASGRPCWRNR